MFRRSLSYVNVTSLKTNLSARSFSLSSLFAFLMPVSPHFRAIDEVWEYKGSVQFELRVSRDDLLHPTHDTQLSADFLADLGNMFV